MIAEDICEYYLSVKRPIKSEVFVRSKEMRKKQIISPRTISTCDSKRNRRVFN